MRGKSVSLNTLISLPHSTPPACTRAVDSAESGEGAKLGLDPTKKSPASGFFQGPLFRETLGVGGTCHSAAKGWGFNHIV